jgi:hypothetical protein
MFKKAMKTAQGQGAVKPASGGSSSMGAGKGMSAGAKMMEQLGALKSGTGGGQMKEMLDKLPPAEREKIMRQLGMTGVKKGGKVSKAKSKPMPVKRKAKKAVKKQSGHNSLY